MAEEVLGGGGGGEGHGHGVSPDPLDRFGGRGAGRRANINAITGGKSSTVSLALRHRQVARDKASARAQAAEVVDTLKREALRMQSMESTLQQVRSSAVLPSNVRPQLFALN